MVCYSKIGAEYRSLTLLPFPDRMSGWHHAASFSESFYSVAARFFDQKNYGTVDILIRTPSIIAEIQIREISKSLIIAELQRVPFAKT